MKLVKEEQAELFDYAKTSNLNDEIIIREATKEDLEDIQILCHELVEYEKNIMGNKFMTDPDWMFTEGGYNNYKANIENKTDYIFVACKGKKIIGYMTCWKKRKELWDEYEEFQIGNLYVRKEYRRQGLGTKFINIAKDLCRQRKIKFLKIDVLAENTDAQKFYKKNGLYGYYIEQFTEVN